MDIDIELEVKAKAFEIYKKILNKNDTIITFNDVVIENVIENITIKNGRHTFQLMKKYVIKERNLLNDKYNWLIPNKILNNSKLNNKQRNNKIKKLRYLKLFKFIYGDIVKTNNIKDKIYYMNYNGVVYRITDTIYNRYHYYGEYAYKIYQLEKLNEGLNIKQNITLYFDEDVFSKKMYDKFHNIFKDVFKSILNT